MEASAEYEPKAKYAIRMLLLPLGLEPRWVGRGALGAQGLYYGSASSHPANPLMVPLQSSTEAYFAERVSLPMEQVGWFAWEGDKWPMLFGAPHASEAAQAQTAQLPAGDLIASTFFWLSGWQAWTAPERDQHGRFPYAASLQAKLDLPLSPCVDVYREQLAHALRQKGVNIRRRDWAGRKWVLCPTHDIDYLKKWRPGILYREVVQYFLFNHRKERFKSRMMRLQNGLVEWFAKPDPYRYAFERMRAQEQQRGATATYFIKTGAHGPRDVYYKPSSRYLQKQVKALEEHGFEVGLHPSYYASTHRQYLRDERQTLDAQLTTPAESVRQHYLRYELPQTPSNHQAAGFLIDSSLAFAEHEGFRRGTCHPFQIYDLVNNAPLNLWELPLIMMDSSLFHYRSLTLQEALEQADKLMQVCQRFNGIFVGLWHNVLYDEMDFPGWGRHFEETLDRATEQGAAIMALRRAFRAWLPQEARKRLEEQL